MKPMLSQPKKSKYYIRQVNGGYNGAVRGYPTCIGNNVLANCVGFANGRFNQIINDPDLKGINKPFKYQLVCNAENFIESAKKQGLKISYVPVEGGIMVWQKGATLSSGDGAGHVAVVERVYNDGTILTSESGWASWAFKTVRRDNTNGRWGQNYLYKFRGCIINPAVKNVITPSPKLAIDSKGGACTIRAMQRFFGCVQDGVLSGQNKDLHIYYPAITAVEFGKGGSPCVKKLQKWVGVAQDGIIGEKIIQHRRDLSVVHACNQHGLLIGVKLGKDRGGGVFFEKPKDNGQLFGRERGKIFGGINGGELVQIAHQHRIPTRF